jgi:methyl coenzyme M reductase subunit C
MAYIYALLSRSEAVAVAAEAAGQDITMPTCSIAFARAQLEAREGIASAIVEEAWTNLDRPLTFGVNEFQLKRNRPRTNYMHCIFRCIYAQ